MDDRIPSALDEALTLICATSIGSSLYTLSLILYCLYARLSYSQFRRPGFKRQTLWAFTLASVMIICGTVNVVLNNQYIRIIFVDYKNLPGGPLGLSAQNHVATVIQINSIISFIVEFLAVGVLLWRVWVIYSGTQFAVPAIILATLSYLASVVTRILHLVFGWGPLAGSYSNVPRTTYIVNVMAEAFTAASKFIMTSMIIICLMFVRQKHIKLMGQTDVAAQYLGIAAMLIESYSLSTIWNFGYLIGYILKDPSANHFFGGVGIHIATISYFLVWCRVFSGRAWDKQTQNRLTTLQWDCNIQPTNVDDDSCTGVVDIRRNKENRNTSTLSSYTNVQVDV
ncbi:hypothetical protein AGABI2DRAFT_179685 [Agaricus bisporus var. bisporus H97]|uniref:hypothetical protein n=1 Tax=Agaricus bisporus var. bisporus (strain H97 / ATCC MYA-4626 / FGSC 10389) TaxID=936046 RepID=UPI00029F6EC0|nr:hypothetical protein AGABI2DRAFT_179685 [Agaricus bisporus var. bisporus H97]EKV45129.1 hypothetical protein AGABI2DRAFT_179685 [Agaricus bisporus var. bisporus H97]